MYSIPKPNGGLGVAPVVAAGALNIGKKIFGSIFGGTPEFLKDYFGGDPAKYAARLTDQTQFRWAWYGNDYWKSPDGQRDLAQVFAQSGNRGGTIADAYLLLFGTPKPEDMTALRNGRYTFPNVTDKNSMIITMFDRSGNFTGGGSGVSIAPASADVPAVRSSLPVQQAGFGFDMDPTTIAIIAAVGLGLYFASSKRSA